MIYVPKKFIENESKVIVNCPEVMITFRQAMLRKRMIISVYFFSCSFTAPMGTLNLKKIASFTPGKSLITLVNPR